MSKKEFETFNKKFYSKTHAEKYFRMILNTTILGNKLSLEAENDFRAIMLYHPHYERKAEKGIKYIYVGMHKKWPTRCFYIQHNDGSCEDISLTKILKAIQ